MAAKKLKLSVNAIDAEDDKRTTKVVSSTKKKEDEPNVNMFEYIDESDEELNNIMEEVEIEVANDSGSAVHVIGPEELPAKVEVVKSKNSKDFRGAGGDGIKNHGKAEVELVTEDGRVINNVVQVADVTRALHSTGIICDNSKEVLFTDTEAVVVPKGALSRFLGSVQRVLTYKRKGGLYVAKMKIRRRVGKRNDEGNGKVAPFGRPGAKS